MQTCFSEFQGKIKLKRPKFETRCLAHASRIEARAIDVLGVHGGAFAQQQLRSRDVAVECRQVQRRGASGGFFPGTRRAAVGFGGTMAQRPMRRGWRKEVVGSWAPQTQPTNEGRMFWTQHLQNCSRQKHSQTLWTSFNATLTLMKRCVVENVQRTDKASINNVFKYIEITCPTLPRLVHIVFSMFFSWISLHVLAVRDNMVCCDIFSCLVLRDALKEIHLIHNMLSPELHVLISLCLLKQIN